MLKNFLPKESYYLSIPDDDLIEKQRYKIFGRTTIGGTIACLLFAVQVLTVSSISDPVVFLTIIIGIIFTINLLALPYHRRSKVAYAIICITSIMLIHVNMYPAGGIKASAAYYYAPITLMSFMLLGNKLGRFVFLFVVANLVYFYYITENTNWVSYDAIGSQENQINLDYFITGLSAALIVAAQINYLESGKNIVIQRITTQRNELREKNIELHKLSIVASKADNAIVISDVSGLTEWVNDGFVRLTGYNADEVIGKSSFSILSGIGTNKQILQSIEEARNLHQPFAGELLKYRKDGTRFWTQITMTPIAADENNNERFIFIESDITSRKIAEEKMKLYMNNLEKTNRELDKFAYVVSHDLKAPLRAIGNLTGWIEEDMGARLPEEILAHFATIKGRVVRMEGLINGILDYTKAAKKDGEMESFKSDELLRETVDLIGVPSNAIVHIRDTMPIMKTERVKMQQIFLNLIHNAIKYNNKEDIQVEVGCVEKGNDWQFYVKDNGPGIEKRYHEKIFVIFQTLNARDEVESRGVGLAIVKKIIEEEGGSIWLDSEKNNGTTFFFTWPKQKKLLVEEDLLFEQTEIV